MTAPELTFTRWYELTKPRLDDVPQPAGQQVAEVYRKGIMPGGGMYHMDLDELLHVIAHLFADVQTGQQRDRNGDLFFDLILNKDDRWVGMAKGKTPAEARETTQQSLGTDQFLLIPFYGRGSTEETFKALTGRTMR